MIEVTEDILSKTLSLDVLSCLRERTVKVQSPEEKEEVARFMEDATEGVDLDKFE